MASIASARLCGLLLLIGMQVHRTCAGSCWRDTPCGAADTASFPGPWESDMFAPGSRTVHPAAVLDTATGNPVSAWPATTTLGRQLPSLVLDFGLEVGGIATLDYTVSTSGKGAIGIAFTEAKNYIGPRSDSTNGDFSTEEGAVYANYTGAGAFTYVMPDEKLRGGFRYMTLFRLDHSAEIQITNVSLELAFQPTWSNLRAYQGYFHSSDKLLNKIWYSGAYTLQTNAIHPLTGRQWPPPKGGWETNGVVGPGHSIITDGAKRDRTVWPGDMGVAVPGAFYSTGDLESVKNALQVLYDYQDSSTGLFPFSGPPLNARGSDTYHMWTMVGTYNYVFYADDVDFVKANWDKYVLGMNFILSHVDSSGLLYAREREFDWGRKNALGTMTSAQAILYRTLVTGATMADWVGDATGLEAQWLQRAAGLREKTHSRNYDASFGAFKDGSQDRPNMYSQDGNSLAVLFGLVDANSTEAGSISSYLTKNWTPIGANCPELDGEVSTFISSIEILAHLRNGQTQRALDLIRSSWGWYLNNKNGTESTMIEGYLTNGSFGYRFDAGYENDASYTSHAHGWAVGPIQALTEYVLGLSITGRAGKTWRIAPHIGDLKSVEGGFTTKLGKFSASWIRLENGTFSLDYQVPTGTTGDVVLPTSARIRRASRVEVDGGVVVPFVQQDIPYDKLAARGNGHGIGNGQSTLRVTVPGGKHTLRFHDE